MSPSKQKISPRQLKAVASLVDGKTVVETAEIVKVTRRTVYRWLRQEAFKAEYRAACEKIVTESIDRLKSITGKAVKTLNETMEAEETKFFQKNGIVKETRNVIAWGPRLGAAKTILENLFKFKELQDIEQRLEALENRITEGDDEELP